MRCSPARHFGSSHWWAGVSSAGRLMFPSLPIPSSEFVGCVEFLGAGRWPGGWSGRGSEQPAGTSGGAPLRGRAAALLAGPGGSTVSSGSVGENGRCCCCCCCCCLYQQRPPLLPLLFQGGWVGDSCGGSGWLVKNSMVVATIERQPQLVVLDLVVMVTVIIMIIADSME